MYHNMLIIVIIYLSFLTCYSQDIIRRDDFANKKTYWYWRQDGNASPPELHNGLASIKLENPISQQYCNSEIMDPSNIFSFSTIRMRVKAKNVANAGSWGWGYWHTEAFGGPNFFDLAWFMEQNDGIPQSVDTWWRARSNNSPITGCYLDLDSLVDRSQWHNYEIQWYPDSVNFWVDSIRLLSCTTIVPQSLMAFHIWIDNRTYNLQGTTQQYSWTGNNEILIDYVEMFQGEYPLVNIPPTGNILFRGIYNEIGQGYSEYLWKDITCQSDSGQSVVLVTARSEQYDGLSDDDDIKIIIDNEDYGWNTYKSFNGDTDSGRVKTLSYINQMDSGLHQIKVYGDITPTLYDITVLSAPSGSVILKDSLVETASGGNNILWKEYYFDCKKGFVSLYFAGYADEDFTHVLGNAYNDLYDDDLMIEIDSTSYGWKTENSLYGNNLFGEGKSIVIQDSIKAGNHRIKLWTNNTPTKTFLLLYFTSKDSTILNSAKSERLLPKNIEIYQNFPNPFNSSTNISFRIYSTSIVKIEIISINGELIKEIINNKFDPGCYNYQWNGKDNNSKNVSSGLYFYKISVGSENIYHKMLLIK